jgi:hypothetical protein
MTTTWTLVIEVTVRIQELSLFGFLSPHSAKLFFDRRAADSVDQQRRLEKASNYPQLHPHIVNQRPKRAQSTRYGRIPVTNSMFADSTLENFATPPRVRTHWIWLLFFNLSTVITLPRYFEILDAIPESLSALLKLKLLRGSVGSGGGSGWEPFRMQKTYGTLGVRRAALGGNELTSGTICVPKTSDLKVEDWDV